MKPIVFPIALLVGLFVSIALADKQGEEQRTHEVAPAVQTTLVGQPARLDLNQSDAAHVKTVQTTDKEVATEISAKSKDAFEAEEKAAEQEEPAIPPQSSTTNPEEGTPQQATHNQEGREALIGMISRISVADYKFVVRIEEGTEYAFLVNSDTSFTLDGGAATFDDLKMGQMAEVTAAWEGKTLVAKTVDATSIVIP